MTQPQSLLSSTSEPLCSLGLHTGRLTGSVIGRASELAVVERELASAREGMECLTAEGEPGIGKTRLLLAIEEMARAQGFVPIGVTTDEEIRGPFLLARSIFASLAILDVAQGTPAEQALQHVVDALSNRDDASLDSLAPDRKLLRVLDLAAVALGALAKVQPLAILIDDLQWADEDSLRMLRYVVRVDAASPILLVIAMRPIEMAFVNEAVTLLADMERMGILKRLKLGRFGQLESTQFLQRVLGGQIDLASAAVMHAQAEGVPYILAEQARAYRDAGLIQQIDGVWTLARNAERLMPSGVRTLIQRRAAHLPENTKAALAEVAILGRSFSLRDFQELRRIMRDEIQDADSLAEALGPAVAAGLLLQHPVSSPVDYSFTHEQIREYSISGLTPARRRAIHTAVVEMLMSAGEPTPESLPLLAQHALAAGQAELSARISIDAARIALQMHAPEEVLRLVSLAQPVTSAPQDRVALLILQDDALAMLRRPTQRLEGLAELSALAEALRDSRLATGVTLRRAAALRLSQEHDRAAELASRVRQLAAERNDAQAELAACLELGQALLRTELGEGYTQTPTEADLDGAAEAFECAVALAESLGDEALLAAATRELGIIAVSRIRAWFIGQVQAGEHIEILRRVAAGEQLQDILTTLPIAPLAGEAGAHFLRALEIYERLGDRQGVMSTIIAMAYISWGPELHLPGSARRIEELRRLMSRLKSLTTESERALAEAQMLFGAHVYARAKVFPDVALSKGEEAYAAARTLGDRALEFTVAGSMAMSQVEIGAVEAAERWLGRAAAIASAEPTALRARQLEAWRGIVRSAAGDAAGMREHLGRAIQFATEHGGPAARCEMLAQLALEAARLGAERRDEGLLAVAERSANDARALTSILPGHPPWSARANAALSRVAMARGRLETAAEFGRSALAELDGAMREDLHLDILLPAADAILAAGSEQEAIALRERLSLMLALLAQRILDEDIRVRWFRGPFGRELTRLVGTREIQQGTAAPAQAAIPLSETELRLLHLLTEGRTNREIAAEIGMTEQSVTRQLAELFVKIGASSRADATAIALMGKLV